MVRNKRLLNIHVACHAPVEGHPRDIPLGGNRPKILYIAGWGRSGSTLLGNLLGQVQGWTYAGELHSVWRALIQNGYCGCEQKVRMCAVWQHAFDAGFGGIDKVDPVRALDASASMRTRHIRHVARTLRDGQMMADNVYAPFMTRLYDGIVAATGARVIVDSTKFPAPALVAAGLPNYEVYVVHIVRDPRAVGYSWKQHRKPMSNKQDWQAPIVRIGYIAGTVRWQALNMLIAGQVRSAVGPQRYLRVHYERLTTEPTVVLNEILDFAGGPRGPCPAFNGNVIDLRPTHTAYGNPSRFATGPTQITLDEAWRSAMPRRSMLAISMLAYPTLRSMGYRWRPR